MDAWVEEMSAVYDKETLIKLYRTATDKPHGFLYIKVNAPDKQDMFYASLENKLIPHRQAEEEEETK